MTYAEQIKCGSEVMVPRHHKPRGTQRLYDHGKVIELSKGVAKIKLDTGRDVFCPVGILSILEEARD